MQKKEELREEIDNLNKIISELRIENEKLAKENKKRGEEIASRVTWFDANKEHLKAILSPVINDLVDTKIHSLENKIVNGLSIDTKGGYGGYFNINLNYHGKQISECSDYITMHANYEEY